MTAPTPAIKNNPLIVIGDKIGPQAHLIAFMENLRTENAVLDVEEAIKYAVCLHSSDVAVALRKHLDAVKMILLGPGLVGNNVTVARMLAKKAHIVMVVDSDRNPLGSDPDNITATQKNLEDLGVIIVLVKNASHDFFEPLVQNYVLSGLVAEADPEIMSPEERAQMIDKRLDAVNSFPSLPETQRKVMKLDDLDPPKQWAEAIDPDVPTRTVILKILNSARYGFRSRVESIDQAVALASAKTIREIVTACQTRQIFQKTKDATIDQYWRHSLAVAFFAKLFSFPADPAQQSSQQKAEFERYQLDDVQINLLKEADIANKIELGENDDTFNAGLLHDIGKITMLMCLEDSLELVTALIENEVQEAKEEGKLWAHNVVEIERFLMKDIDHQVIGARLADKWELDDTVQRVVANHHETHENSAPLLKLVALANIAASTLFPYPATDEQHPFPQLLQQIEKLVKKSGKQPHEAVAEAISQDLFEDLVDVITRLEIPNHLWKIVDFKTFFQICYLLAPNIRSSALAFMQQTGG